MLLGNDLQPLQQLPHLWLLRHTGDWKCKGENLTRFVLLLSPSSELLSSDVSSIHMGSEDIANPPVKAFPSAAVSSAGS